MRHTRGQIVSIKKTQTYLQVAIKCRSPHVNPNSLMRQPSTQTKPNLRWNLSNVSINYASRLICVPNRKFPSSTWHVAVGAKTFQRLGVGITQSLERLRCICQMLLLSVFSLSIIATHRNP